MLAGATGVLGLRLTAFITNTTRGRLADVELWHRRRARHARRTRLRLSAHAPWRHLIESALARLAALPAPT